MMLMTFRTSPFGAMLRSKRRLRRLSQEGLAHWAATTSRHISFLETGRSRPTATMVDRLCEALAVPIVERNAVHTSAGLPPPYADLGIADPGFTSFRTALDRLLVGHQPMPGFAIDRGWRIIQANAAAKSLIGSIGDCLVERMFSAPMQTMIENWSDLAWATADRLQREVAERPSDPHLAELLDQAMHRLAGTPRSSRVGSQLALCPRFRIRGQVAPTIMISARFGGARATPVADIQVELLYPDGPAAEALLRGFMRALPH